METTRTRIRKYIENQSIRPKDFLEATGLKRGILDKSLSDKGVTDTVIAKILEVYRDVNPIWLITGEGDITNKKVSPKETFNLRTDFKLDNQTIPLYNIEATAGLVELFQNHSDNKPIDTIHIPNLPKCDGAVFVTGDSMYPLLKSGDIIAYKQVNDIINNIFWGEMYLISIDLDGEEYVSVKYIQKSDQGNEYIKLVSQNTNHQPKDVHLSKVKALAFVKASIRINSMS